MELNELVIQLRNVIGDNDPVEPNIADDELKQILNSSAREYSRLKSIVKIFETPFEKDEEFYDIPNNSYKVKSVVLKELPNFKINFIDNLNQIILENLPDVNEGTLKITYSQYFLPNEIDERELDIYLLFAESLCYKLMASKTADYIKFSTGEKMMDESLISKKYLDLYEKTVKIFKNKAVKAYGRRVNNLKPVLDYDMPYPPLGERP